MKLTKITKEELQMELKERQKIAKQTFEKKRRHYGLAKGFLEDFIEFNSVLDEIPDSTNFNVINQNSSIYKRKQEITTLFESFSIVLLLDNDEFYIYYMAKYKLE